MRACSYVSPSLLPSRTANAVHVVHQCEALGRLGVAVDLYARRTSAVPREAADDVRRTYGVELSNVRLRTFRARSIGFATNLGIAGLAALQVRRAAGHFIHCRNLYASYWFGIARSTPLIYETHHIELGSRAALQRAVLAAKGVVTVVISAKLRELLAERHGIPLDRCYVLHDAAPGGAAAVAEDARRESLAAALPPGLAGSRWRGSCGYFGHLYPGRGIEIIEAMAAARPDVLFVIVGGNEADIEARRSASRSPNVQYLGFLPHPEARRLMAAVDVLLMPYQSSVSIGATGHDTARWMSPMKMFEYMASGRPIISSDLDVLREVLTHGSTAMLVPPADAGSWISALDRLLADGSMAARIGATARAQCEKHHTWESRARRILEIAANL